MPVGMKPCRQRVAFFCYDQSNSPDRTCRELVNKSRQRNPRYLNRQRPGQWLYLPWVSPVENTCCRYVHESQQSAPQQREGTESRLRAEERTQGYRNPKQTADNCRTYQSQSQPTSHLRHPRNVSVTGETKATTNKNSRERYLAPVKDESVIFHNRR